MQLPLFLKRWLSYFQEVPVEYVQSEWHPVLVVKLSQGKFILDGARVNYAFGGLDTFFRLAFQKLDIPRKNMRSALLLGFGVGNVATILKEKNSNITVTGVDADPVMKDLAEKYFSLRDYPDIELVQDDVVHFINTTSNQYDLVVVDVFLEENIPEPLQHRDVLKQMARLVKPGGMIFFNTLGDNDLLRDQSRRVFAAARKEWKGARQIPVINNLPIVYEKKEA